MQSPQFITLGLSDTIARPAFNVLLLNPATQCIAAASKLFESEDIACDRNL
ncbi:MAG: hypothetical protein ACI8Z0_002402 [Lentimonas sp.]|jgi:hypothetical protein